MAVSVRLPLPCHLRPGGTIASHDATLDRWRTRSPRSTSSIRRFNPRNTDLPPLACRDRMIAASRLRAHAMPPYPGGGRRRSSDDFQEDVWRRRAGRAAGGRHARIPGPRPRRRGSWRRETGRPSAPHQGHWLRCRRCRGPGRPDAARWSYRAVHCRRRHQRAGHRGLDPGRYRRLARRGPAGQGAGRLRTGLGAPTRRAGRCHPGGECRRQG